MLITVYMNLADYWDVCRERVLKMYKRPNSKESIVKRLILPYLGNYPLNEITAEQLEHWKRHCLEDGNSNNYVNYAISLIRKIFHYARKDRKIMKNPCEKLSNLPKSQNVFTQLTEDEEQLWILESLKSENPEYHILQLTLGIRNMELLGCKASAIQPGRLRVDTRIILPDGTHPVVDSLQENFRRYIALSEDNEKLLRQAAMKRNRGNDTDGFLFFDQPDASMIVRLRQSFRKVRTALGRPHLLPIHLTYNYGVQALEAGENPKAIMIHQGYKDETQMKRYYAALEAGSDNQEAYGSWFESLMEKE